MFSTTKYFTKTEKLLETLQAHNTVNFHKTGTRLLCNHSIIYPITKATRWWENPLSPPLTKSKKKITTNKTEQHSDEYPYKPTSHRHGKTLPANPTCPILSEHHQISPQIDHLHNLWLWIRPFTLQCSNFSLSICPSGTQLHQWCNWQWKHGVYKEILWNYPR